MNMKLQERTLVGEGDSMITLLNLFIREMGCSPAMSWATASNLADDYELDQAYIAKRMALSMKESFEPGLNPVAFVKEHALAEHGIEGIEVKPNDPDGRFIVADLAEAEAYFANLLWKMDEQSKLPEGKKPLVTDILVNCGTELNASTQERLRTHFIF